MTDFVTRGRSLLPTRPLAGLAARMQEPRVYVLTYSTRWRRRLPIRARHNWEKVCSWDEALAMQAAIRAEGATDCEVRYG